MAGNHALVYGASGITGWAIVNQILNGFPTKDTFASVTALANRPLSLEVSQWPKSDKLDIVSGIDLMTDKGQSALEAEMKEKIKNIDKITHVYFFAYILDMDPKKECDINKELIKRAVTAAENLSTNLKFVVLPTGTKAYGVHLLDANFPFHGQTPLKETLPRIPEPYASQMFYYDQTDMLSSLSKGKPWTWCEIIPDNISGFVPHNNIYGMAQTLSTYLSLVREKEGEGAEVQFPGTTKSWTIKFHDSAQDQCARISIAASLRPETTSEQRYNAADTEAPLTWETKWPAICAYFGLKGTPPPKDGPGPDPPKYMAEHFDEWQALEKKHGLVTGRVGDKRAPSYFAFFIMGLLDFDRDMDMSKCKSMMGDLWTEVDTKTAWYTAFDRYKKAKIIP